MCPYVNIRDITSFVFVTKYDTFCRKKCNFYYHMLLRNKFISPCYKTYLGRHFGISDKTHWEAIYIHKICDTHDNDISEFNYKLLNNLLCNNLFLSKWKQDITKFCSTCKTEVENSEHLIFTCNNVKNIWYTLGISLKIDIQWKHIVIGFFHENNIKVKTLNNLISFTAMKIYKFKMVCRLEKTVETSVNIHMNLKKKLIFWLNVLRYSKSNMHTDVIKAFYDLL